MKFDALIIGGGPAGTTTALLLAEAGWSVAIIEKKIFPRRKVCGEFISATSLPLLQKLGLADFYTTYGGPEIKRVGLFASDTMLTSAMPLAKLSLSQWGRALGREHLDKAMLDKAMNAGAKLWQPWLVKSLKRKDGIFTCTIADDCHIEQLSSRIVIMANGSWERSLESLNKHPQSSSDLLAFKAHFKNSMLDTDLMPLVAFPGGYGGLVHSDHGRVTLSCCIRRDMLKTIRQWYPNSQAGEAVLCHIKSSCLGVRNVLLHAERVGNWLAAGPIQPGIRKRYENGIFFVGNIAGEAHPVVAEGISMAMQSGWLLSEVLLKHQNEIWAENNMTNAGRDYKKLWNMSFRNRIHTAAILAQLTMRPWIMMLLLPIVKLFPSILTFGAKLSGKIKQVVPAIISIKSVPNEKENTI